MTKYFWKSRKIKQNWKRRGIEGRLDTTLCIQPILRFSFLFLRVFRVYRVCYCRYQVLVYVWWIKFSQKHTKLQKYFITDCRHLLKVKNQEMFVNTKAKKFWLADASYEHVNWTYNLKAHSQAWDKSLQLKAL